MAMVCTQTTEWIQETVSKPIEDWEESTEKKCKKAKWYNPLKYLCWLARILVAVIRWVFVTVLTAVITIACRLVAGLLSILWDTLKFLGNLLKALLTWDKCALQAALGNLADAVIGGLFLPGDVIIRPITDRIQTYRLRNHVAEEIDRFYADRPDLAEAIKQNLNINSGVFGYRLTVTLHRMFVDSETRTPESGAVPFLIFLHNNGVNLFELAGFDHSCDIFNKDGWRRSLPRTARKMFAGGGGDLVETDPPEITRENLQEYIDSNGSAGPPFFILAMSTPMQESRIKAAQEKGRQLGLILSFDVGFKEVTDRQFIDFRTGDGNATMVACNARQKDQQDYLVCELGRSPTQNFGCCDAALQSSNVTASPDQAARDLCKPVAVGVFRYTGKARSGWANNLTGTTGFDHDLRHSVATGVTFRAQIPEALRKWVLIHELGHYFGLTHVDGFDRLMVSGEEGQGDVFTRWTLLNILWHGGPRFIFTEAERVWKFILTNFPPECLAPSARTDPGVIL